MRNNYFFTRDICHHWAGVLIHKLSGDSWGHTCKSHLISFTGVTEQPVCSYSSGVFTSRSIQGMVFTHWKLFQHPSLMTRNTVSICNFFTTSEEKTGCGGPCLSSQLLQRWVDAHEPGASVCSASFLHHIWHWSDNPWTQVSRLPREGRAHLDQKQSISVSGSRVHFTQGHILRLWWFKSIGQLTGDFDGECTHSSSCALCYRDNAEVRHRLQCARVVRA